MSGELDSTTSNRPEPPSIRQWETVCFCEEFWLEHKAFPSYAIIKKNVPGYSSIEEVETEVLTSSIRKMLKNRGIDYSAVLKPEHEDYTAPNRLSDKQLAVISTLLNPLDTRTQSQKLKELGVLPVTFQGWLKSKRFSDYFKARSEELFGDALPLAHDALVKRVADGDIRAIKLFYEVSGRYTGVRKEEVTNLKLILARVTELMQKYIDPVVMPRFIDELNSVMLTSGVGPNNASNSPAVITAVAEREDIGRND